MTGTNGTAAHHAGMVIGLHALSGENTSDAGVKAATLGVLARAGIAVPEGLVLTAAAARATLADTCPRPTVEQVLAASLPPDVEAALDSIARHFGDATLVVRSSAAAEDLPDASYAGQHDSVLGVRGRSALDRAVRRCWASVYGERIRAYRPHVNQPQAIAVLVQRQIDADVAGVAFSANPVTGVLDEVLVSAVPGLADTLVGGAEQPDEWVVRGGEATPVRVARRALTAGQALAVAELALRIQRVLGGPVDVEWAMAGGRLLAVQARPITALPHPPAADFPPGIWIKDVDHYPEPLTAFGASIAVPWVAEGLSSMLASWGGLLDRMETWCVGGEAYLRAVPPRDRDGTPPPWWVLGLLARITPSLLRRMRAARRMVNPETFTVLAQRWETEWRPRLQTASQQLHAVDVLALDDGALDTHVGLVVETAHEAIGYHFHLIPLYTVPVYELVHACTRLLGWSESEALALLAGTSVSSSAPARSLADLAGRISRSPKARATVELGSPGLAARLADADPALATAYADWRYRYATRSINSDPGSPVYTEQPWLLDHLLRDAVHAQTTGEPGLAERTAATRAQAAQQARTALSHRLARDREDFERTLTAARRYYPLREDTTFWLAQLGGACRLALLEAGRRLADRGQIVHAADAAQLDLATLRRALTGRPYEDLHAQVTRARAERAWVHLHPGPAHVGSPPPRMPDIRGLPAPGRRLNAALMWAQPKQPTPALDGAAILTGSPGSPGAHTGPVRIVCGAADFDALRAGEVLVAPTADPAWSVLFAVAGALVTDSGGILSHAAIIAREHALPAVVGTRTATSTLTDGEIVTVDGTTGRVYRDTDGPSTS
ncbi:MAG: hypothetical protein J0I11_13975 [Actinobacteria bacterium]|nr:hypothetical protein [Actinomycetota bacterium]